MLAIIIELFSRFSTPQLVVTISGLALFVVGLLIYAQDTTKRRGKFFLFFMGILLWWGIALAFLGVASHGVAHSILIMLYLSAGMTPLVSFFFLDVPMIKGAPTSFLHYITILVPPIIIIFAIFSPGFIVKDVAGHYDIKNGFLFGKGYILYFSYQAVFFTAVFWSLLKKYRLSAGIFKLQARDMLATFIVAISLFVGLIFVYPGLSNIYDLFLFGYISISLGALLVGLILIKYNFWSVEIIVVEFLALITTLILLGRLFFLDSIRGVIINTILTIIIIISSLLLVEITRREIKLKDEIARILYEVDETRKRSAILEKKKTEFLAIASHHLRDPLTAIKGYSSMIIDGSFGETPPLVFEAVVKIFESSKRLATMISDFLNISEIESGNVQYLFTNIDMEKLVTEATDEMRLSAKRVGTTIDVTIDKNYENYFIKADINKMRQVVSSIIDNAVKYTPQGRITVLLSNTPDNAKIILSVSDTGIGMNKNTLEKIFKKFSRASGINKVYTEGLGLGLYVAKEIVDVHKGRIWAVSEGEGTGSTFYVEIPASIDATPSKG